MTFKRRILSTYSVSSVAVLRPGQGAPRFATTLSAVALLLLVVLPACSRAKPTAEKTQGAVAAVSTEKKTAHLAPPAPPETPSKIPAESSAQSLIILSDLSPEDLQPLVNRFAGRHQIDIHVRPLHELSKRRSFDALLLRDPAGFAGLRLRPWKQTLVEQTLVETRRPDRQRLAVGLALRLFVGGPELTREDLGAGGLARRLASDVERLGWCPTCSGSQELLSEMRRAWGPKIGASRALKLKTEAQKYPTNSALFAAVSRGDVEVGLITLAAWRHANAEHKRLSIAFTSMRKGPMASVWPLQLARSQESAHPRQVDKLALFLLKDPRALQALSELGYGSAAMDVEPPPVWGDLRDRVVMTTYIPSQSPAPSATPSSLN